MHYEAPSARIGDTACAHYWMLNGKNTGVCSKCGARRHFPASWSIYSRPKTKKQ